jgi:hypothetical protein
MAFIRTGSRMAGYAYKAQIDPAALKSIPLPRWPRNWPETGFEFEEIGSAAGNYPRRFPQPDLSGPCRPNPSFVRVARHPPRTLSMSDLAIVRC